MQRNRIQRTASKRWRGSVRRILAAAVYNLSCFTHGCSTGWVSGVLGSEALTGGAWLAALPCLVALPAAPIFASLADTRGRKTAVFVVALIFVVSCSLAAWCGGRGVWAARIAAGAGGAGSMTLAPLYCAEIAPRTRGLTALPALACSCGLVFTFVVGACVSAHALSVAMLVPPTALLLALIWLPETPEYLISVGRIQEAAKIMCWFDGSDFQQDLTDVIEEQEVHIRTSDMFHQKHEVLMRQDSEMFQPMLKRSSGATSEGRKKEVSAVKELFVRRGPRRALVSCCALVLTAAGTGVAALSAYTSAILRHARHRVPALNVTAYNYTIYNGTIVRAWRGWDAGAALCGAALVLGAVTAALTVDKLPRKMLLLWSCTGIAFCLTTLGVYCDPRLRIYSWYIQNPWPYTLNPTRPSIYHENYVKLNFNHSKVTVTNMSDTSEVNTIVDINNVADNVTKTLFRFSVENETVDDSVMWKSKVDEYQEDSEETFWLPIVLISATLFLYNFGLGSVPYVLVSEFFSIQVRSLASSVLISWMWLSTFFLLRYFGTIAISFGLHATYYICATLTLLGALYIFLIIPETKGKSQQQIEDDLNGPLIVFKKKRKNER